MSSSMTSSLDRTPPEIWYMILQWVLNIPMLFDNTCIYQKYFGFRGFVQIADYEESERQRKCLGMVCKGWRDFAENNQHRWLNFWDAPLSSVSPNDLLKARQAIRIDLSQDCRQNVLSVLRERDSQGNPLNNRLSILTLYLKDLDIYEGLNTAFLCKDGELSAFRKLTYLQLYLESDYHYLSTSIISDPITSSCPCLIGLDIGELLGIQVKEPITLRFLEVLTFRPQPSWAKAHRFWLLPPSDQWASWRTPRLRHFAIEYVGSPTTEEYNYMAKMMPHLESLQLSVTSELILPKSFWTDFPDLKLFLANWRHINLSDAGYPPPQHPLEIVGQQFHSFPLSSLLDRWEAFLVEKVPRSLKQLVVHCKSEYNEAILNTEKLLRLETLCSEAAVEFTLVKTPFY